MATSQTCWYEIAYGHGGKRYYGNHLDLIARVLRYPDGIAILSYALEDCINNRNETLQRALSRYGDRGRVNYKSKTHVIPVTITGPGLAFSNESWEQQAIKAGFTDPTAKERAAMLLGRGLSPEEVRTIVAMNRLSTVSLAWALNCLERLGKPFDREHIIGYAMTKEICERGAVKAFEMGAWPTVSDFHSASCVATEGAHGGRLLQWLQKGLNDETLTEVDVTQALVSALDYHPASVLAALSNGIRGDDLAVAIQQGRYKASPKAIKNWELERTLLNFRTQQFREGKRKR